MLEISSFGRMPRQLKDHFLLSAPQIFQEVLLQRYVDSNALCRCCACAFAQAGGPMGRGR